MNKTYRLSKWRNLCVCVCVTANCIASSADAQSVIFPQPQQAGTALLNRSASQTFQLANDLFAATYSVNDGVLSFDGASALGLNASSDLFLLKLASGEVIASSAMTLQSVESLDLTADADAAKASLHYAGKALQAVFTRGTLTVTWRAVLRDGSHYLRTEMEITTSQDIAMSQITPLLYNYDNSFSSQFPDVVGNTRGAVLANDKIFAGLETPMGIVSVGYSGATEDTADFTYDAWTSESWGTQLGSATPQAILNLGFTSDQIVVNQGSLTFEESGNTTITFTYSSGTHRLNVVGVDVIATSTGDVVASDYHIGYTGSLQSNNTYTLNIPEAGTYRVRYFAETKTETITSSGSVAYSRSVAVPTQEVSGERTLQGVWSRGTTLAAGNTWTVSSVVGLIAPGQARRSFLAYSERERAVPWRPFSLYNSWYELNIDRNNDADYHSHMTTEICLDVMQQWRTHLFDKYNSSIKAFVWDDGWDSYGTWTFNPHFPNGFKEMDELGREMNSGIGAWLGPVGGYGTSGSLRRSYWTDKGGMQLSNPDYYNVFLTACSNMIKDYDFRFFKFDGISTQWSSVGPDSGTTGEENAEGIIALERAVRAIKPDIFLNTTVGTWASPFWFQISDAVWRQENDWGTIGDQGTDREKWITYRDRLVYQNFVQNSPLCPINTLMTHGVILTNYGDVSKDMTYNGIVRELRCAYACGSGMVELYTDYALLNSINDGALWGDIAECIAWQEKNADVLPDVHWVGGNPWDGSQANVYGWASWNGTKATLALRNPRTSVQKYSFTLREALDIPDYITGSISWSKAFTGQSYLPGFSTSRPIDIDATLTVTMPASTVFVFDGVEYNPDETAIVAPDASADSAVASVGCYDLSGRKVSNPRSGCYIINGVKTLVK